MAIGRVYKELLRGKSLGRALQNEQLIPYLAKLKGSLLDLGGGYGSHYRFLPKDLQITRTNLKEGYDVIVDIGKPFPFPEASFDAVLLLNALYVVPNQEATLKEIHRVLRPGGMSIVSMPFMLNEVAEPHDYVRFTREGLEHLFSTAGFPESTIEAVGERFSAALTLMHVGPLRFFTPLCAWLAVIGDRCVPERLRKSHAAPISYIVYARK